MAIYTIEQRIMSHLPNRYHDTLRCYEAFTHQDWEDIDTDTGELVGFISYFLLDFSYDMIICAAKDNKFSKAQWKILRRAIVNRVKPLRIMSDPDNMILRRAVKKYGGYWLDDEIIFPYKGVI